MILRKLIKNHLLIIVVISILLCSCSTAEKVELSVDTPGLKSSMIDFFEADDQGYVKGEAFQAKMISCDKVIFDAEDYDTSYTHYVYQLVLAPVTNERIKIKNIHFSVNSPNLVDYFKENQNKLGRRGLFNETTQIGESFSDYLGNWKDETQMVANLYYFYVDNMGDDWQSEAEISSKEFDEGMKELVITIDYNHTSETLLLKYNGELITISEKSQVEEIGREEIVELYYEGRTNCGFIPFEN